MRRFWQTLPLFGLVRYTEQSDPPERDPFAGYVDYGDGRLVSAIYMKGEWRNRHGKRVQRIPVSWFRMERPDGTPLF